VIYVYLSGAASALAATAAVFFLRYWRASRDRFFAIWAVAFGFLAAQWGVAALSGSDSHSQAYLLRLGGFLLIGAAIVDKNRSGAGGRRGRTASAVTPRRPEADRGAAPVGAVGASRPS
jgi:hypothetical protein